MAREKYYVVRSSVKNQMPIGLRDLQVMPSEVAQRRLCEVDPNYLGIKDLSEEQDLSLKL